jgi:hypothetical protein
VDTDEKELVRLPDFELRSWRVRSGAVRVPWPPPQPAHTYPRMLSSFQHHRYWRR